jgi:hypothetical protein
MELAAMRQILGRVEDYLDLLGYVDHWLELPRFYSRAKVYVLASLIEGKNRTIGEAMACNVPIVCFREFNQFARQGYPVFPDGTGLYAAYDPESLADTIHTVLEGVHSFSPRLNYLKQSGRRNFLNQCIDTIPYYRNALPDFVPGQHIQNPWIDVAVHRNYGKDLHSFIYRPGPGLARGRGLPDVRRMLEYYRKQMEGRC